jgi:hypothetical protein
VGFLKALVKAGIQPVNPAEGKSPACEEGAYPGSMGRQTQACRQGTRRQHRGRKKQGRRRSIDANGLASPGY